MEKIYEYGSKTPQNMPNYVYRSFDELINHTVDKDGVEYNKEKREQKS